MPDKIIKKARANNSIMNNKTKKAYKVKSINNVMKGGDDGRYVLPGAYFGKGTDGYYEAGSSKLSKSGSQLAASRGTIWDSGNYTGPNLYPTGGGSCGCNKRKSKNARKSNKSRKSSNSSKSKHANHKRKLAVKSQNGGFWSSFLA